MLIDSGLINRDKASAELDRFKKRLSSEANNKDGPKKDDMDEVDERELKFQAAEKRIKAMIKAGYMTEKNGIESLDRLKKILWRGKHEEKDRDHSTEEGDDQHESDDFEDRD